MSLEYGHKILGVYGEIPLAQIIVHDDRRALNNEHVTELKKSITSYGLINPIALYHPEDENEKYYLLAGRHRLSACAELKMAKISARIYDHILGDHELKAIELYENLHRKDLTDVEIAQQTQLLHQLMQKIHGPSIAGSIAIGHSIKDTAKILGKSVGTVHSDLKLANIVKNFPELGLDKITSKITALRIAKRMATAIVNQQSASTHDANPVSTLANSYLLGDFFQNTLPSNYFGILEVDPPYGIDLPLLRDANDKGVLHGEYNEVMTKQYPEFLARLTTECYRLAANNAWIIFWHGHQWYQECVNALATAGFIPCLVPAIWKKGNSMGQSNSPDSNLGLSYEQFIYARKGTPKLQVRGRSNIFDYAIVSPSADRHPTERPVELIQDILNTFSWPNTPVLSPFLGSGNTIIAAAQLRMPCIGFDISERFRNSFVARHTTSSKAGGIY